MRPFLLSTFAVCLTLSACATDDPVDPAGPGGSTPDDAEAIAAAEFATPVVLALAEQATTVAALDPNGLAGAPPLGSPLVDGQARVLSPTWSLTWDVEAQEWIGRFQDDQMPASDLHFEHRVQYQDAAGVPLASDADLATSADRARHTTDASMFVDLGLSLDDPAVSGTVSMTSVASTTIAGLLEGTDSAVATARYALAVDMTVEHDGETRRQQIDVAMDTELDIAVADSGCPTGTARVTYPGYRVDVAFDGTSTATWELRRLPAGTLVQSGAEDLGCAAARPGR